MSNLGWKHLSATDKAELAAAVRSGTTRRGPFHLELHPADRCNIDCFFCSTAALRGSDEMEMTRVEELVRECRDLGVRSVRLAGGGEPLFHRKIRELLACILDSGLRIENVTTNAVLLRNEVADLLIRGCDEITISLNTFGAESYAAMMQTPARNYERVIDNVRSLVRKRDDIGQTLPEIRVQFLVWRDNYRDIPSMYELARSMGADRILFNGLSFLPPEKMMSDDERMEMLRLYEALIRRDEFRRIERISSFEHNIDPEIGEISRRIATERRGRSLVRRIADFLDTSEFPLSEKIRHHRSWKRKGDVAARVEGMLDECIIGFYSLVVRTSGDVAPCCILQGTKLGNVYENTLEQVWFGGPYESFRSELSELIAQRSEWSHQPGRNDVLTPGCASSSENPCPLRSSYYRRDPEFARSISAVVA